MLYCKRATCNAERAGTITMSQQFLNGTRKASSVIGEQQLPIVRDLKTFSA